MLSNTAVPRHYAAFREKVLSGEIPVSYEINLEMQRIDRLVADPNVYYDDEAIDGFVEFCEAELTLTNGDAVHLLDSFKLWAEQLLSWKIVYYPKRWDDERKEFVQVRAIKRLREEQYLIVARGGAKSMYVAFLQMYFLTCDLDTTQQATIAPTMKQAEEVMAPLRTAIQLAPGPFFQFLTLGSMNNTTGPRSGRQKLASTKRGIENFMTNSYLEIRPMSIDKVQGLRTKYNSVDEWLSGETRENVILALMQGARKHDDPVLVAISSEGVVRNGVGDDIKMELQQILKDETRRDSVSIFHYKLDDVKEVDDPRMWVKAQPNIGITVSYETYADDVAKAKSNPSARNEILAKRFGLPMEGLSYYFTYEETIPHAKKVYNGLPCSLGVDLSRGDDFCAFTFLFPLREDARGSYDQFGVKTRNYITRRTMDLLPMARRLKYEEFMREGTLIVFEGTILDPIDVYEDLNAYHQSMDYDIRSVGYDPYGAKSFMDRYELDWGPYGVEKVIQGARTESVPLGELKKIAGSRDLLFDESIMQFAMGHAVAWTDSNGNRKLHKRRQDEKIDPVSAMLDSYVALRNNPDMFR